MPTIILLSRVQHPSRDEYHLVILWSLTSGQLHVAMSMRVHAAHTNGYTANYLQSIPLKKIWLGPHINAIKREFDDYYTVGLKLADFVYKNGACSG